MKRMLAHIAVSALIPVTLALVACGDDNSTTVVNVQDSPAISEGDTAKSVTNQETDVVSKDDSTPDTTVQKSDSVSLKTVIAKQGRCGLKHSNYRELAYLVNNENVGYQIVIPDLDVDNFSGLHGELPAKRVGDTLCVEREGGDTLINLGLMCYAYYTLNIPAEDADINYVKFMGYTFKVVEGPAPEKEPDTTCHRIPQRGPDGEFVSYMGPNGELLPDAFDTWCRICTFAPTPEGIYDSTCTDVPYDIYEPVSSNSTVGSSSSVAKSSSSAAKVGSTHQIITDAQNQCTAQDTTAHESYAYRYVSTERTGFTLETLRLTYGIVADTLDVDVSGDTVYVKAVFDFTNAERMYCQSQIHFSVENNPAFSHAKFVAFFDSRDDAEPVILEIYDMDVITVEEATRRHAKDIAIECKNDRQTLNRPMLSKTTFAPDFDTTSTKHIAGRVVGDDGFDMILINELDVGCGVENVNFEVSASNDTLYVQPSAGLFGTNCICPSRINFKIEQNSRFSNTNVLVFGHFEPMPLVTTVPVTFRSVRQE